jgi:hypothetical protein
MSLWKSPRATHDVNPLVGINTYQTDTLLGILLKPCFTIRKPSPPTPLPTNLRSVPGEGRFCQSPLDKLKQSAVRPKNSPPIVSAGQLNIIQLLYGPPDVFDRMRPDALACRYADRRRLVFLKASNKMKLKVELCATACLQAVTFWHFQQHCWTSQQWHPLFCYRLQADCS